MGKKEKKENETPKTEAPVATSLAMVTRKEWKALPPKFPGLKALESPAMLVMLRYFTGEQTCQSAEDCKPVVKELQKKHQWKDLTDIAHNFLIAPDGTIFEGRGWVESQSPDFDMSTFGKAVNLKQSLVNEETTINLAYIGDHRRDAVTDAMKQAVKDIISQGVRCLQIAEKHKFMEICRPDLSKGLKAPVAEYYKDKLHFPFYS